MSEPTRGGALAFAKRLIVPFVLAVASLAFVAANAPAHDQMSLFDEYVYIDYLDKFPEQGMVHLGEMTGDLAREYYSCQGVEVFGKIAPENCTTGDYENDAQYPFGGINSADIYTPLYFGVTWTIAQPIIWITGVDLVEAGRLAGFAWLASAAILLYYALGKLRLSQTLRISGPLMMIASVSAWWSTTYVSTDASAFLAGSTLLLLGLRFIQTGRGGWALALASTLAVALKLQNFMAVVAMAVFIVISVLGSRRRTNIGLTSATYAKPLNPRKVAITFSGMIALPLMFQVGWVLLRSATAVGNPPDQQTATPLGVAELIRESFKFFGRIGNAVPVDPSATVGWALSNLTAWLLIAGAIAVFAHEPRWSTRYSLSLAYLLTAFTAGPALAIATRAIEGYYFDLPARYGISLLPIAIALAATLFDGKREARIAFAGMAGITFVASLTPFYPGAELLG